MPSPVSRAQERHPLNGLTSQNVMAACPRMASSVIGTEPKSSRESPHAGDGSHVITFVPHLGACWIAEFCRPSTSALKAGVTENALGDVYQSTYAAAPFVRLVGSALPEIKHVAYTNFCDVGWRVDASGRAVLVSVIDNLLKGASGQAVQNLNVMRGIDERTGLW